MYMYFSIVWFEPTCVRNSVKPIRSGVIDKITYASPNLSELHCMHNSLVGDEKQAPPLNGNIIVLLIHMHTVHIYVHELFFNVTCYNFNFYSVQS